MTRDNRMAGGEAVSVRELLLGLSPDAEWLLTAASVFREPVPFDALPTGAGGLPGRTEPGRTAGLVDLIGACAAAGLVTVASASQPPTVQVAAQITAELRAHLMRAGRADAIVRAHRHAANYWQWRVASPAPDWQSGVHDLLEARHHLIEAQDLHPAETITEDICSRLHAFGAYAEERTLIGDTLARIPGPTHRQPTWAYRLGKACHLEADDEEAEHWFRQALGGFERLADARGLARCYGYLGALAHAHGDYAEAERCYLTSHALEQPPATASADGTPGPGGRARAGQRSEPTGEGEDPHAPSQAAVSTASADGPRARLITARARRRRVVATAFTAVAVLGACAALAALPARQGSAARRSEPALTVAAAARNQAAAWLARWGSDDAIVACDPLMCAALQSHGLPAARLLEITSSTADPLGSDLVAASAAVRGRFGARLGTVYAPAVIASFGGGGTRIDVRVVAANGAAAYRGALRADLAARRLAGTALLGNPRVTVSAAAAKQLAAGRVDSRLLITLAALAASRPVAVIAFGGAGPGSSASLPLLSADVTAGVIRGGRPITNGQVRTVARALAGIVAFLRAQRPPLLAARVAKLRLSPGISAVRIEFAAPSPLGLLIDAAAGTKPSATSSPPA